MDKLPNFCPISSHSTKVPAYHIFWTRRGFKDIKCHIVACHFSHIMIIIRSCVKDHHPEAQKTQFSHMGFSCPEQLKISQFWPNFTIPNKFQLKDYKRQSRQCGQCRHVDNPDNTDNAENRHNNADNDNLEKYFSMWTFSAIKPVLAQLGQFHNSCDVLPSWPIFFANILALFYFNFTYILTIILTFIWPIFWS